MKGYQGPKTLLLWSGPLVPPLAWYAALNAGFVWAPLACGGTGKQVIGMVFAAAVIATLAAGGLSWTCWQGLTQNPELRNQPGAINRTVIAAAGMAISLLFLLVLVGESIPALMFRGCE